MPVVFPGAARPGPDPGRDRLAVAA